MQTTVPISLRGEFAVSNEYARLCRVNIITENKNRVESDAAKKLRRLADDRPVLTCSKWEKVDDVPGGEHWVYRLDALVIGPFDMREPGMIHRLGNELAMFVGRQFASPEQERTQWY